MRLAVLIWLKRALPAGAPPSPYHDQMCSIGITGFNYLHGDIKSLETKVDGVITAMGKLSEKQAEMNGFLMGKKAASSGVANTSDAEKH